MNKNKAMTSVVLPESTFQFLHLDKPDTAYNPDGTYSVTAVFSGDAAQEVSSLLGEAERTILGGKSAYPLFKDGPDGSVIVKAKTKAVFHNSDGTTTENVVPVFDADGNRLSDKVWRGAKGQLAIKLRPYNFGNKQGLSVILDSVLVQENGKAPSSDMGVSSDNPFGGSKF